MKKLKFQLPFKAIVYEDILSICCEWHEFITAKKESLLIEYHLLELGSSIDVQDWQ